MVACILCRGRDGDQSTVAVLATTGGDTLGDDGAAGVASEMDHLRAGVRLLVVVGHSDRVKFSHRVVTPQDAAGILPRDSRSCLNLCPRYLATIATAQSALGNEVVDTASPVLVAWVPVLDCRVLDLSVGLSDDLDDRSVKLVLVTHRSRATL